MAVPPDLAQGSEGGDWQRPIHRAMTLVAMYPETSIFGRKCAVAERSDHIFGKLHLTRELLQQGSRVRVDNPGWGDRQRLVQILTSEMVVSQKQCNLDERNATVRIFEVDVESLYQMCESLQLLSSPVWLHNPEGGTGGDSLEVL